MQKEELPQQMTVAAILWEFGCGDSRSEFLEGVDGVVGVHAHHQSFLC